MVLPNFFVVGAQKSGTTSLHEYLRGHPQIYLPEGKETKFFADEQRYMKGIQNYEENYFSAWNGEPAIGEVDPDYMYFEQALERIGYHLDLNKLKFIFVFRNPADRAFSHYLMTYRRGFEPLTFEEALAAEPRRIQSDYMSRLHFSYADRGFYAKQVRRFLKYIDRSQMLFLLAEELSRNPGAQVSRCWDFLGVDSGVDFLQTSKRFHQATVPRSMMLLNWLRKEAWQKALIRRIAPIPNLRKAVWEIIFSLNQKVASNHQLDEQIRYHLMGIYSEDMEELATLTGLNTDQWKKLIAH